MARRRNKLLIPEARHELNQLKTKVLMDEGIIPQGTRPEQVTNEVAKDIGIPFSKDYNGNLSTKNAGKIGGKIGGRMVRELIRMGQEELVRRNNRS